MGCGTAEFCKPLQAVHDPTNDWMSLIDIIAMTFVSAAKARYLEGCGSVHGLDQAL